MTTDRQREAALDMLSDFVSGLEHERWRTLRYRRRLIRALGVVESRPLREHEAKLVTAVRAQQVADEEQATWERMGGAK